MRSIDRHEDWLLKVTGLYGRTSRWKFACVSTSLAMVLLIRAVILTQGKECNSGLLSHTLEGREILVPLFAYFWLQIAATRRANDVQKTPGKLVYFFYRVLNKFSRNVLPVEIGPPIFVGTLFAMGICLLVPEYVSLVWQMILCSEELPRSVTIYVLSLLGGGTALILTVVLPLRVLLLPSNYNSSQHAPSLNEVTS